MSLVIDHLYIDSLEGATNSELLNISHVISLGCDLVKSNIICSLKYLNLLDMPESNIIDIFEETNTFIDGAISRNENVLVHCVYGQSRSATIVVSYLLYSGRTLDDSLSLLSRKHPGICINPGFLAQLYLFGNKARFLAEYRLAKFAFSKYSINSTVVEHVNLIYGSKTYCCLNCNITLLNEDEALTLSDASKFVNEHVDDFWKGYTSTLFSTRNVPNDDSIFVGPVPWISKSTSKAFMDPEQRRGDIHCPNCFVSVGCWDKDTDLRLCSGYLKPVMAFTLSRNRVVLRKKRKRPESDGLAIAAPPSESILVKPRL